MDEGAWDHRNVPLNGLCGEGAPIGVNDFDEKEGGVATKADRAITKADRKAAQVQYEDFLTVRVYSIYIAYIAIYSLSNTLSHPNKPNYVS